MTWRDRTGVTHEMRNHRPCPHDWYKPVCDDYIEFGRSIHITNLSTTPINCITCIARSKT